MWFAVADALRRSGFGEAGPEYLRLSAVLQEQRSYEMLRGAPAEDHWVALREQAAEALRLLEPMRQAALLITELPIDVTGAAERSPQ